MKRCILVIGLFLLPACGDESENENNNTHTYTAMDGAVADCEFDVVTFKLHDASLHEVSINGLPVEILHGAIKEEDASWTVIERRGVRFSSIFTEGGLTASETTPVNCIARDNYDTLRGTALAGDTSKIPQFAFMRDYGYIYVGDAGDKDPLYPEMEGKTLRVDYHMSGDADVPEYLGSSLSGLGKFRYKMVEKVDDTQKGVFEIDPVI